MPFDHSSNADVRGSNFNDVGRDQITVTNNTIIISNSSSSESLTAQQIRQHAINIRLRDSRPVFSQSDSSSKRIMTTADYHHSEVIGVNLGSAYSDFHLIQDGIWDNITAVIVGVGGEEGIDALQVQYNGMVWSSPHGRLIAKVERFTLEEDEFIVGIRGRVGRIINSIEFETNTGRRSPEYQNKARATEGMPFSLRGEKLIYFSGTTGWSLDSLQAHWIKTYPALAIDIPTISMDNYRHSEVIGGNRALEFSDFHLIQDGLGHNITAIAVGVGGEEGIDALQVQYDGEVWSSPHGRPIAEVQIFALEKDESIICIRGTVGRIINSIVFETNTGRISREYRNRTRATEGVPFSVRGKKLVYFSGGTGWSLDSLQAHWIKNQPALAITEAHYDHSEMIGGNHGLEFSDLYFIEDGLGHNITAIAVGTGGEEGIDALQVQYDRAAWSSPHGRLIAEVHVFTLEKDEFIVCIKGSVGRIINSIEFETNTGRRSPEYRNKARAAGGVPFSVRGNKLAYFSGGTGWSLDSLQAHWVKVQPMSQCVHM